MPTRSHTHHITLSAPPEAVFRALHTPSAIRQWWQVSRAIVIPTTDGVWAATWGDDEDQPDYVSAARLAVFDPPRRLVMRDMKYVARSGDMPFRAEMSVEFTVAPSGTGSLLRVTHEGIPSDPAADEYYSSCEKGWRDTLAGIERYFS